MKVTLFGYIFVVISCTYSYRTNKISSSPPSYAQKGPVIRADNLDIAIAYQEALTACLEYRAQSLIDSQGLTLLDNLLRVDSTSSEQELRMNLVRLHEIQDEAERMSQLSGFVDQEVASFKQLTASVDAAMRFSAEEEMYEYFIHYHSIFKYLILNSDVGQMLVQQLNAGVVNGLFVDRFRRLIYVANQVITDESIVCLKKSLYFQYSYIEFHTDLFLSLFPNASEELSQQFRSTVIKLTNDCLKTAFMNNPIDIMAYFSKKPHVNAYTLSKHYFNAQNRSICMFEFLTGFLEIAALIKGHVNEQGIIFSGGESETAFLIDCLTYMRGLQEDDVNFYQHSSNFFVACKNHFGASIDLFNDTYQRLKPPNGMKHSMRKQVIVCSGVPFLCYVWMCYLHKVIFLFRNKKSCMSGTAASLLYDTINQDYQETTDKMYIFLVQFNQLKGKQLALCNLDITLYQNQH